MLCRLQAELDPSYILDPTEDKLYGETVFKIRTISDWYRARYLSATKAPGNIESLHEWTGKKHYVSLKPT